MKWLKKARALSIDLEQLPRFSAETSKPLSSTHQATAAREKRQAEVIFFRNCRRPWRCRARRGRNARPGRRRKGKYRGTRLPVPGSGRQRSGRQKGTFYFSRNINREN